jgi:hypothetical protein
MPEKWCKHDKASGQRPYTGDFDSDCQNHNNLRKPICGFLFEQHGKRIGCSPRLCGAGTGLSVQDFVFRLERDDLFANLRRTGALSA